MISRGEASSVWNDAPDTSSVERSLRFQRAVCQLLQVEGESRSNFEDYLQGALRVGAAALGCRRIRFLRYDVSRETIGDGVEYNLSRDVLVTTGVVDAADEGCFQQLRAEGLGFLTSDGINLSGGKEPSEASGHGTLYRLDCICTVGGRPEGMLSAECAEREGSWMQDEIQFLSTFSDRIALMITEAQRSAGMAERDLLSNIVENESDAVLVFDDQRTIQFANCAALSLISPGLNTLIGKDLGELLTEIGCEKLFESRIKTALEEGKRFTADQRIHRGSAGRLLDVEMKVFPISQSSDNRKGLATIVLRDISQRKRAEAALLKRESTLREAQLMAQLGYWEWNPLTDSIEISKEAAWVFGLGEEERTISSVELIRMAAPNDRRRLLEAFRAAVADASPFQIEIEGRTEGRGRTFVRLRAEVETNDDGKAARVYGLAQDVTVGTLHRLEVEKQNHSLSQQIELAESAIFVVDSAFKITVWNRRLEQLLGPTPQDVLGMDAADLISDDEEKDSFSLAVERSLKGMALSNLEATFGAENGRKVALLLNVTPQQGLDGTITGVVITAQDITELRRYQAELQHLVEERTNHLDRALEDADSAREQLDAILKSLTDGLIVTDAFGRIVLMNTTAEDLLGTRLSQVLNRPVELAFKDETPRRKIRKLLNSRGTGHSSFEFTLSDGGSTPIRVFSAGAAPIFDQDGKFCGTVTTLHDVTEERNLEAMKSNFLSTSAHELRTPLTSIRGYSELLLNRSNLAEETKQGYLTYIHEQSVHLSGLVEALLDISRFESGYAAELNFERCSAGEALGGLVQQFQSASPNHTFRVEAPAEPTELVVDKPRMTTVLENVLSNAVRYSPDGGEIFVRGSLDQSYYQIEVTDSGIGMTPEVVKRMFDLFYRGDNSNTSIGAAGIGMTVAKQVVEEHGGWIKVNSRPGEGTTIQIGIPLPDNPVHPLGKCQKASRELAGCGPYSDRAVLPS